MICLTISLLYKVIRKGAEFLGAWKFFDERPLSPEEMRENICLLGKIVEEKLLWSVGLTQYAIVVKKRATSVTL